MASIESYSLASLFSAQRLDGVYAFGYNSAESEPIWMKSGTL